MSARALFAAALLLVLAAPARAELAAEGAAARETQFDHLRLLTTDRRLARLGTQLGYVEKDTRPAEGMYVCGGMSRSDALAVADTVSSALQRLPDESLTRLGLRYVVLCSSVTQGGRSIGGIPVPPLNLLMLDTTGSAAALQHRTLHELYHLVEYRYGSFSDAAWDAQFGAGYSNSYPWRLETASIGSGKAGFINAYGETYAHEERAELFAYLMLSPRELAAQARGDSVLKQKTNYVIDKCQRLLGLPLALP